MNVCKKSDENCILEYKVCKWSSYSHNYLPQNILVNKPAEQSSRWSSETNNPPQYLLLKLSEPAIICSITFGKYEKTHVCNLKRFKVLGGMEEQNLVYLLQAGLKNDSIPEAFALKHKINGQPFPCRYLKIVPLLTWGASYNFSIWYIEIHGINTPEVVQPCLQWYYKYRENQAIRLCLKHFRHHNYIEAFDALQKKTKVILEDPVLSELHKVLVLEGNFEKSEIVIENIIADDMFSHYIDQHNYEPYWQAIIARKADADNSFLKPGMRGGHQMCMDEIHNCIYIFGGWNGTEDMADFWKFSCGDGQWTFLSKNTEEDGGPSARSCHKLCIDCKNGRIYTLGRYLDSSKRTQESVQNDFYVYNINNNAWSLISKNVALVGGPRLIFDHQMCFDTKTNTIFVFGGRVLTPNATSRMNNASARNDERTLAEFSGLYSYNIDTDTWTLLREDSGNAGPQDIRSRIGHSMLLDTKQRRLYIFGGQRSKEYINDFFFYDIDHDHVTTLNDGTKRDTGLPPGFTQRATIDSACGEIYVLSGLSQDREKREENMHNSFWIYIIRDDRWACVYKNEPQPVFPSFNSSLNGGYEGPSCSSLDTSMVSCNQRSEPCPRYAHQLVYDCVRKVHYMFGGNPGRITQPKLRLDDFWCLRLTKLSKSDLLRKCRFMVRKQKFRELVSSDPLAALPYLQNVVSAAVDHDNQEQVVEFRSLASVLFGDTESFASDSERHTLTSTQSLCTDVNDAFVERTALFDELVKYFPEEMTQPKENLLDMVVL